MYSYTASAFFNYVFYILGLFRKQNYTSTEQRHSGKPEGNVKPSRQTQVEVTVLHPLQSFDNPVGVRGFNAAAYLFALINMIL